MRGMTLAFGLFFIVLSVQAQSISAEGEDYQIGDYQLSIVASFHENMRSLSCGYAREIRKALPETDEEALISQINEEIRGYQKILNNPDQLRPQEASLIKEQIRALRDLRKSGDKRGVLSRFASSACPVIERGSAGLLRSTSHFFNVVQGLANLPFRAAANFIKGLWSGQASSEKRQDLTEFIGTRHYKKLALFSLYKAGRNIISGPTLFLPVWLSPVSEYFTAQVCLNPNDYNSREAKFCSNYNKTKSFFHRLAHIPKKAGAWIRGLFGSKEKQAPTDDVRVANHVDEGPGEQDKVEAGEEERFCRELMDFKEESKKTQDERSKEVLGLMLNPGQFSTPERFDVSTTEDFLRRLPEANKGRLKNIVISLAPNYEEQEAARQSGELARYKELADIIEREDKKLRFIYKADSVEDCERRKKQKDFSAKTYNDLAQEKASLNRAQRLAEHELILKQVNGLKTFFRKKSTTKLAWEIIEVNDIRTIHSVLKREDVGNVIIVTHGKSNGKIVDAQFNELPSRFFAEISPSIMSIGFYQCHSQKILKTYKLKEKFANMPSYHKLKHLFFVQENHLFGSTGLAPVVGFKNFFKKLDAHLYRSARGNELLQNLEGHGYRNHQASQTCSIELGSAQVDQGSLRLLLNRKYVDLRVEGEVLGEVVFPCSFLNNGTNVLVAQSGNLKTAIEMDASRVEFYLNAPGAEIRLESIKHYSKPKEDSYASSKIIFNLNTGVLNEEIY